MLRNLTRNRSITDVYEPGSTFKVITTASALDSGAITTHSTFYCPGYRIVDGQKIKCWSTRPHGTLDLTGAVQNSCNPAFMDMALKMGTSDFYNYIYDFGFGAKTGIRMYGESGGIVTSEKYVKNVDLARIGFGQAIAITPLQLVSAVSAVVNGGNLMQPYITEAVYAPDGSIIQEYESEVLRRVISEETSDIMRQILFDVVDDGSGRNAKIEGYNIGGKTGTAQKYGENGEVLHDKHISSFIAVAPTDNPQLVVLITVNEPTAGISYGSIVAAPYAKMFLEEALPYLNIMPDTSNAPEEATKQVPYLIGLTPEEAQIQLSNEGFGCIVEGYSGNIVSQIPGAGTSIKKNHNVVVQLEMATDNDKNYMVEVPDLFGLTPTQANKLLIENNLTMMIVNSGNVVLEQYPSAGTLAYKGTQISVSFDYNEVFD